MVNILAMEKMKEDNFKASYSEARIKDEDGIRNILKCLAGDESNFEISRFIVAKDGNKIIGCVRTKLISRDCLELASLGVLPEYQNKGIGSNLVRKILEKERFRPIFLLTSSDKETYYERFGASVIDFDKLPQTFKREYMRVVNLPFTKDIQVIAMVIQ